MNTEKHSVDEGDNSEQLTLANTLSSASSISTADETSTNTCLECDETTASEPEHTHVQIDPLDDLMTRLLSCGERYGRLGPTLATETELCLLATKCRLLLLNQPMLLEIAAPVTVVGDIHGQYKDLLRLFELGGQPPTTNYLFLGDYVDRGSQSLETVFLLMLYKCRHPLNFFLLRGNHECSAVNRAYGMRDECLDKYSERVYSSVQAVFDCLPVAAIISGRIMCMHGGISPKLQSLDQLRTISRPLQQTMTGLVCDLLWADPSTVSREFARSRRGISYEYGPDAVDAILKRFNLDLICRGHQVVQDGYEFSLGRRVVTIFSAPHYCGDFTNDAAIMRVSADAKCTFERLRYDPRLYLLDAGEHASLPFLRVEPLDGSDGRQSSTIVQGIQTTDGETTGIDLESAVATA